MTRRAQLTPPQVDRIVRLFTVRNLSFDEIGRRSDGRTAKQIRQILWRAGIRLSESGKGIRIPDEKVKAMHADYMTGIPMAEVARRHGRSSKAVSEVFRRRGLVVREYSGPRQHKPDGTWKAAIPIGESRVAELIASATDIAIPRELALDWRKWTLRRRADFVARLRDRLGLPLPDPALFSANVTFFCYGTPAAHALMEELNRGTDSRGARVKINLKTWGVIHDRLLWTWSPHVGFINGPFVPGVGRAVLHHHLYRLHHGPVPAGHIVRHVDGNRFNLDPANLVAVTRNLVARENQAAALVRKSRERVGTLLKRQTNSTDDLVTRIAQAS